MQADDSERFPFRRVAAAAFVPTILFAIGEGAILPFIPAIAGDLGASLAIAGLITAMLPIGELLGSAPGGLLVARIGERPAMIAMGLVTIAALVLAWFATELWMLAIAVVVIGVATAIFGLARHAFMTTFVPYRYRARALSALGGTFRLGMFVGPLLSSLLLSLGADVRVTALVFLVACVLAVAVLLLLPDPTTTFERATDHAGAVEAEAEAAGIIGVFRAHSHTLFTVGFGAALLALARRGRDVILPLWAVSIGVGDATTGLVIGLAGAVDFLLFFTSGYVMDRFGRLWSVLPSLAGLGLGFGVLALTHDVSWAFTGWIVAACVLSVANGLGSGILMTVGADLAPPGRPAPFLGAWRMMTTGGSSVAPLLIAGVIQLASIAWAAGALVALCAAGAVVMARTLPPPRR